MGCTVFYKQVTTTELFKTDRIYLPAGEIPLFHDCLGNNLSGTVLGSPMLPEIPTEYTLPVARPDWAQLLEAWKPLLPKEYTPWLLTKFGELFVTQQDGKVGMLQVSGFRYEVVAKDATDFREWLVDPDKLSNWFLAPLVDRLEASGRMLEPDKCYSFIQPLGMQGKLTLENVMVIPIREHFGCWGEVFRQIKDLPDGAQVQLKFK